MKKYLFLISWLFLSSIVLAEIPRQITVQGILTDNNGVPLPSGSYTFQFNITDSFGNLIWSETQDIFVKDGLFNAFLNPPTNALFDKPYFLEVTVNGNVLTPRVRITSSGYAFASANLLPTKYPITIDLTNKCPGRSCAEGRDAIEILVDANNNEAVIKTDKPNFWLWSTTTNDWANLKIRGLNATQNVFVDGRVGIGTTNIDINVGLDVRNSEPIGNTGSIITNTYFFRNTGTSILATPNNFDGWINMNDDSMFLNLRRARVGAGIHFLIPGGLSGISRMSIMSNGDVGIGTSSPGARLHVDGGASTVVRLDRDSTSDYNALQFTTGGSLGINSWEIVHQSGGNMLSFRRRDTSGHFDDLNLVGGNIGIGTTTPSGKLSVKGSGTANTHVDIIANPADTSSDSWAGQLRFFNSAGTLLHIIRAGSPNAPLTITPGYNGNAPNILKVAGNLDVSGNMRIDGSNTLEFGVGVAGKEVNAGKIGYQTWTSGALDIVGAGTSAGARKVKLWDNVEVPGSLQIGNAKIMYVSGNNPSCPTGYAILARKISGSYSCPTQSCTYLGVPYTCPGCSCSVSKWTTGTSESCSCQAYGCAQGCYLYTCTGEITSYTEAICIGN